MTDTTHYDGCYDSGPRHYECALLEVKKLRGKADALESILHSLERIEDKQNKPWVSLTHDEATEIWERGALFDSWELVMQVQQALKDKNGG